MDHPWKWLVSGQNASAVSAAATVIAALSATAAGIYAVRAYRAAQEQVVIARQQAELSYKQFLESVRPQLSIIEIGRCDERTSRMRAIVKNVGMGRALYIEGGRRPELMTPMDSLYPGSTFIAEPVITDDCMELGKHGARFVLWYSSPDGRRFRTETWVLSWNRILDEKTLEHPGNYRRRLNADEYSVTLNTKFDDDPRRSHLPEIKRNFSTSLSIRDRLYVMRRNVDSWLGHKLDYLRERVRGNRQD